MTTAAAGLTATEIGLTTAKNESLASYTAEFEGNAAAVTPLGQPIVLLLSGYWSKGVSFGDGSTVIRIPTNDADQQNILFHELFHTLGVKDLGGSAAFGNWVQGGCKGDPPKP